MSDHLKTSVVVEKARDLLKRAEVDRAVLYVLTARAWLVPQTLITLIFVCRYLTPQIQGYYYTFFSLVGLQTFFDLGLSQVTLNMASHEWSSLGLDASGRLIGDSDASSRLAGLARFSVLWYATISFLFVVVVGIAGYVFLSTKSESGVVWQQPWCFTAILAGLTLWAGFFVALLEGCNQVEQISLYRLIQAVLSRLVLWIILVMEGELWAVVGSLGVGLLCTLCLAGYSYRRLFASLLSAPSGRRIQWRSEIWPMQWRVGLSSAVSYFGFGIFVPIAFHYQGSVMAGRMGMTLQAVGSLHQAAMAWVTTKVPKYGILIKRKAYQDLDKLWFRCSTISVGLMAAGTVAVWLLVLALNAWDVAVAQRLLPVFPTALFLAGATIFQFTQCQSAYLRAHKQEPMAPMNVATAMTTGLLAWLLGSRFGPEAVGGVYLAVSGVTVVWGWRIWARCREDWHRGAAPRD
jgi:hypothetical protein